MSRRSYFKEVSELEATWDSVWSSNIVFPQQLSKEWLKGSAFCIGSGGSLSLAKAWQCIHETYGLGTAKTITPYEFYYTRSKPDIVILITASGKNHDIRQAFNDAILRGCKVLIFTASQKSPLINLSKEQPELSIVIQPSIHITKDGFLAVNSVIAIACLMAQVAQHIFRENYQGESPVQMALDDHLKHFSTHLALKEKSTVQIIASEWGMPAGLDLEARLAESAVGNCFLTDPRNFGHGRFLWLNKRKKTTMMVFYSTPMSQAYIKKFIKSLPKNVICHSIESPFENLFGAIYCLTRSILLFGEFARQYKVDPGRPSVPQWGRKLHRLYLGSREAQFRISTKAGNNQKNEYPANYTSFSGMVLDIDGTLLDTLDRYDPIKTDICKELDRLLDSGLRIGFATGRGLSAVELLRKQISERFHGEIIVGLHNGTLIGRLTDDFEYSPGGMWPLQKQIMSSISEIVADNADISQGAAQISIRGLTAGRQKELIREISLKLGKALSFIKLITSGHSIDILPAWANKLLVVQALIDSAGCNVLCLGDQGQQGGNDEDLLNWQPSISVGKKRPASDTCFWIGKHANYRESSGTLIVLKSITKHEGLFKFNEQRLIK